MTTPLLEALEAGHVVEVQFTYGRCVPQLLEDGNSIHHAHQRGSDEQVKEGAGWVQYLVYRITGRNDATT